jgi:hypothetical protein
MNGLKDVQKWFGRFRRFPLVQTLVLARKFGLHM